MSPTPGPGRSCSTRFSQTVAINRLWTVTRDLGIHSFSTSIGSDLAINLLVSTFMPSRCSFAKYPSPSRLHSFARRRAPDQWNDRTTGRFYLSRYFVALSTKLRKINSTASLSSLSIWYSALVPYPSLCLRSMATIPTMTVRCGANSSTSHSSMSRI